MCIGQGQFLSLALGQTDIDGQPRIQGANIDVWGVGRVRTKTERKDRAEIVSQVPV